MDITNSGKTNRLEEYSQLHHSNEILSNLNITYESGVTDGFEKHVNNLMPIAMKISAKTLGSDLISVKPMEIPTKPSKSKAQQLREERINKIRQIEGDEPNIILDDDIKIPDVILHFMDFKYGTGNTQNNI